MMTDEQIAHVCNEANAAYCRTIGDDSQPSWKDAPEDIRKSAVDGVAFVRANPGAPQSAQHDNWWAAKTAAGWKHGPVKDADKKEHPCMVHYISLPPEQRLKDALFQGVARALLSP